MIDVKAKGTDVLKHSFPSPEFLFPLGSGREIAVKSLFPLGSLLLLLHLLGRLAVIFLVDVICHLST